HGKRRPATGHMTMTARRRRSAASSEALLLAAANCGSCLGFCAREPCGLAGASGAGTAGYQRGQPLGLARDGGDGDVYPLQAGLDLADPVTHGSSLLEVERLRRRPHLVLQQSQLLPQVVEGELAFPRR